MLWVTREYVHLDRVAAPWLITRFVDAEARFSYVPWGKEHLIPAEAIPLALPGAELGPHDAEGSTFEKVMRKYGLGSPPLERMGHIIRTGIDIALAGYRPGPDDRDGQIAAGLLTLAEGCMLVNQDDDAILAASFPVYDALYALFLVEADLAANDIVIPLNPGDGRGPSTFFESMRGVYNRCAGGSDARQLSQI